MIPKVSVIIPIYNTSKVYLKECLDSISSQTLVNFECFLIDDSDNDDIVNFLESYVFQDQRFIHIKNQDRLGKSGSRNYGIHKAHAEYIAFMDADDISCSNRLDTQYNFLKQNPEIDILGSNLRIIINGKVSNLNRVYPEKHHQISRKFFYANAIAQPSVMMKKSIFLDHNIYFDTRYNFCEDLDLWLRLLNKGLVFHNHQDKLILYRQEDSNREIENWKFNILVRLRNLNHRKIIMQLIFIVLIAFWMVIPSFLKKSIYNRLILNAK